MSIGVMPMYFLLILIAAPEGIVSNKIDLSILFDNKFRLISS